MDFFVNESLLVSTSLSFCKDLFLGRQAWMENRKSLQLFSSCWHSVLNRNCWAKNIISPERFAGVAQRQSGFFLIKSSCQILSSRVGGEREGGKEGKKYMKSGVHLEEQETCLGKWKSSVFLCRSLAFLTYNHLSRKEDLDFFFSFPLLWILVLTIASPTKLEGLCNFALGFGLASGTKNKQNSFS